MHHLALDVDSFVLFGWILVFRAFYCLSQMFFGKTFHSLVNLKIHHASEKPTDCDASFWHEAFVGET